MSGASFLSTKRKQAKAAAMGPGYGMSNLVHPGDSSAPSAESGGMDN